MAPPATAGTRRAAIAVWAAMLALPVAFLGMSEAVPHSHPGGPEVERLFFWVAVASSALGIGLSRVLPRRITPGGEGANPEVVAFTRMAVGWALVEAVALFPLVARLLVDDARLLAVFAVDMAVLLTLFPSEARWASQNSLMELPPGSETLPTRARTGTAALPAPARSEDRQSEGATALPANAVTDVDNTYDSGARGDLPRKCRRLVPRRVSRVRRAVAVRADSSARPSRA